MAIMTEMMHSKARRKCTACERETALIIEMAKMIQREDHRMIAEDEREEHKK